MGCRVAPGVGAGVALGGSSGVVPELRIRSMRRSPSCQGRVGTDHVNVAADRLAVASKTSSDVAMEPSSSMKSSRKPANETWLSIVSTKELPFHTRLSISYSSPSTVNSQGVARHRANASAVTHRGSRQAAGLTSGQCSFPYPAAAYSTPPPAPPPTQKFPIQSYHVTPAC